MAVTSNTYLEDFVIETGRVDLGFSSTLGGILDMVWGI